MASKGVSGQPRDADWHFDMCIITGLSCNKQFACTSTLKLACCPATQDDALRKQKIPSNAAWCVWNFEFMPGGWIVNTVEHQCFSLMRTCLNIWGFVSPVCSSKPRGKTEADEANWHLRAMQRWHAQNDMRCRYIYILLLFCLAVTMLKSSD